MTPTVTPTPKPLTVYYSVDEWNEHKDPNVTNVNLTATFTSDDSIILYSKNLNFTRENQPLKLNWIYSGELSNGNFTIKSGKPIQFTVILVEYVEYNDWKIVYDSTEYNVKFVCTNPSPSPTPTPIPTPEPAIVVYRTIDLTSFKCNNSLNEEVSVTHIKLEIIYDGGQLDSLLNFLDVVSVNSGSQFVNVPVKEWGVDVETGTNIDADAGVATVNYCFIGNVTSADYKLVYTAQQGSFNIVSLD